MSTFKIDKNVPLPDSYREKYGFNKMDVGDSIVDKSTTSTTDSRMAAAAYVYGRRNGMVFTARKDQEGVRIWRTS